MGTSPSRGNLLYRLYASYVGEPESTTSVYGYWLFLLGFLVGVIGIVVMMYEFSLGLPPDFVLREAAFVMAAVSLPLALFGIVLMLPVRPRGIQVAVLGLIVAAVGIAWFSTVYPAAWGPDATAMQVISVYGVGVVMVAGVAALIPVVTGERSALAETVALEPVEDQSPVYLGDALRGAVFAVFDKGQDWTWRLIEEEAIADTADEYLTRLETEERVEDIREQIAAAGMLEIKGAAFRLYDTEDGSWRWMLVREDGGVVADGGDDFETRNGAEESVNQFKEYAPDAEPLTVDGAAFDYIRDGNRWRWILLDENRAELAASPEAYRHHHGATTTVELVKGAVPEAGVLSIDTFGIELVQESAGDGETADGAAWGWTLITAEDDPVAHSTTRFESRNAVESAAADLLTDLESAVVIDADKPVYEVVGAADGWNWRLVGAGADVAARGHEPTPERAGAERGAETMKANVGNATIFEIDDTSFEVYDAEDGWRWRLVDEGRDVIAVGDAAYPDRETAEEAVERVRAQAPAAELIEFDTAAFQIYEVSGRPLLADGGEPTGMEWRWRLIDEGGDVLADSGDDYGSREQALSSMTVLKKYAPDAELLEIDTAAFELHENDVGEWFWRLIDETGALIARSGRGYPSRQAARGAMDRLVESAPETESRAMETAGFQVYHADDSWRWRFVLASGAVVADGAAEYATRDQATAAIEGLREDAAAAPVRVIDRLAIVVTESDGTWRWEIVDIERESLAAGDRTYADRAAVDEEVRTLQREAGNTIVFDIDDYVFWLRDREGTGDADGGWDWRLIDEDRNAIATSATTYESERVAREAIDRIRRIAPDAGAIDYDVAAFELTETPEGWRWQLIDEDERVIAAGTEVHPSAEAAIEELEAVRAVVADASILEIDTAAFELYDGEDGWRWRLVDDSGDVVGRSIEAYADRGTAREEMRTVKELGPSARTAVAEYA